MRLRVGLIPACLLLASCAGVPAEPPVSALPASAPASAPSVLLPVPEPDSYCRRYATLDGSCATAIPEFGRERTGGGLRVEGNRPGGPAPS